MESIGGKIYGLRKKNGISQEALGFALGVSRQTISRWERDAVNPTVENLESLTKFFGINSDYFLNDPTAAVDGEAEVQPAIDGEDKKVHKFKSLKIMAVVAAVTLLTFCAVACGLAAYVAVAPVQGQEVVTASRFNMTGIICLSVGLFAFVLLVALLILCLIIKKKSKS